MEVLMRPDANRFLQRGAVAASAAILAALVAAAAASPLARSGAPAPTVVAISGQSGGCAFDDDSASDAGSFSLQERLGDGRRLCARVRGSVRFDEHDGSLRELAPGSSVVLETRADGRSQRMRVTGAAEGPRYEWWLNGVARAPDPAAHAWLADALQVVAACRAIGEIQGQVGELQGRIGEIQGEVGSLQGAIGEVQGRVGELEGRVGEVQGERGSLEGAIGGHQGAIGGLQAARAQASPQLAGELDAEIETHRAAIRELEARLDGGELARRLSDTKNELRRAESASHDKIAELERRIADVRADERIDELEHEITGLHADERVREIEARMQPSLERLKRRSEELGR
jgi:hypothetical protein